MEEHQDRIRKIVFVALFAALISVFGIISVPVPGTPIPIVLQNMLVILTSLILGAKLGVLSVALFLFAGLIGLPVFSGGGGGLARILGPTGGFLYGYLLASFTSGLIVGKSETDKKTQILRLFVASFLGFAVLYIPGIIHFMLVLNKTFSQTLKLAVLPYLIPDTAKACIAPLIAYPLKKNIKIVFNAQKTADKDAKDESKQ